MRYDETAGIRGLKQLWKAISAGRTPEKIPEAEELFGRYTKKYIDRCHLDWIRGER